MQSPERSPASPTQPAVAATSLLEHSLEEDGLVRRDEDGTLRTTRRFQGAMMRALARLMADEPRAGPSAAAWQQDLRLPLAAALMELYEDASNATIATLVGILLPIQARLSGGR